MKVFSILAVTQAADWGYEDQGDSWNDEKCVNGTRQSPINLQTITATAKAAGAWKFKNYDEKADWTIANNGHSIVATTNTDMHMHSDTFGDDDNYKFHSWHIHWGSDSEPGSEHEMDDKQFDAEAHLVHWNTKYGVVCNSFDEAVGKGDGLAVLGFFIEKESENDASDDHELDRLIKKDVDENVQEMDAQVNPQDKSLMELFVNNADTSQFFRYLGSLTTPKCQEAVVWTVFVDPITISKETYDHMIVMTKDSSDTSLVKNFRNVQPVEGREITLYTAVSSALSTFASLTVLALAFFQFF
ncbi:Oidioi.mRNA.OKI2018_I69.chr2.g4348.t1.cds [Oikopleura dioica]|uniref:Carbonic anhydrase n=1 Tax=Oikopleura dioica TaxID=34765 RepID=A0ABN7SXH3_OIKDI|nr:Oidioi.mRNA.OKI2018_I69.chr2.g4348.t1.cds [Oikopleura dioica]